MAVCSLRLCRFLSSATLYFLILLFCSRVTFSFVVVSPTFQYRLRSNTTPHIVSGAKKGIVEDSTIQLEPRKKIKSNAKRKRKKQPEGPAYWKNETDCVILRDGNLTTITSSVSSVHQIHFKVRGNPRPLHRHRTARGFMYNPSSKYQASFREVVQEMIWNETHSETPQPLVPEGHQLAMRLVFHMKRPKLHFVANKPGPGRLRPTAPGRLAPTRTDVDNLAKFVLDSLNGLLYADDRQVASIHATKIYDNEGTCDGCIDVSIQRLCEQDVEDLLLLSSQLF